MISKLSKRNFAFLLVFGVLLGGGVAWLVFHQAASSAVVVAERQLMGTRWLIQVAPANGVDEQTVRRDIESAFEEVARVESIMSEWRPDSPISAVNAAAGEDPVSVPDELRDIILRARDVSERSDGAFDVTWKGMGDLWSLREDSFSPPDEQAIAIARARVDYRKILVQEDRVGLAEQGMQIGLGGIAKGYGVDRAADVLQAAGLRSYYIDGGGDIRVSGTKHGRPWRVAVRHPRGAPNDVLTVVEVSDAAIVTSGDYENFRVADGRRYHHIIDPRTGRPAEGCQSVTVVAPSAETADALATAAFVLGPEKGLELIAGQPGAEALIVDSQGRPWRTEHFAGFRINELAGQDDSKDRFR